MDLFLIGLAAVDLYAGELDYFSLRFTGFLISIGGLMIYAAFKAE